MQNSQADDYPRAIKIVTIADITSCNNRYFLRAIPPEDMLEAKEIYTEVVFKFDLSVPLGNRRITRVGVAPELPIFIEDDVPGAKYMDKIFTADSSGLLTLSLDLTPYMVSNTGDNWIELLFDPTLESFGSFGSFKMWKVELVHTTEGVRSDTA